MQAGPTEEVAAHRDDRVRSHIEADVALEGRIFSLVLAGARTLDRRFGLFRLGRRSWPLFASGPGFHLWLCWVRSGLVAARIVQVDEIWKVFWGGSIRFRSPFHARKAPRLEPEAAGWEAQTLPPSYALSRKVEQWKNTDKKLNSDQTSAQLFQWYWNAAEWQFAVTDFYIECRLNSIALNDQAKCNYYHRSHEFRRCTAVTFSMINNKVDHSSFEIWDNCLPRRVCNQMNSW